MCMVCFDADPDDYTGVTMMLTFSASQTASQSVQITIIDDILVEDDESFNIQASSATNDPRVSVNDSPVGSVTATIIDNDSTFIFVTECIRSIKMYYSICSLQIYFMSSHKPNTV